MKGIIILSVLWIGFTCVQAAADTPDTHQFNTYILLMIFATAQLRLSTMEMLLYDTWKSYL